MGEATDNFLWTDPYIKKCLSYILMRAASLKESKETVPFDSFGYQVLEFAAASTVGPSAAAPVGATAVGAAALDLHPGSGLPDIIITDAGQRKGALFLIGCAVDGHPALMI